MKRYRGLRQAGFNLIELMVVVLVLGILAAIAYPVYTSQVERARRADAQAVLLDVMQAEERHYTLNNTYTTALKATLGFPADPVVSEEAWYTVAAAACGSGITQCVQLTATAQGAQASDDCGNIALNSRGQWSRSGTAPASECY